MSAGLQEMVSHAAGIDAEGNPLEEPDNLTGLLEQRRFKPGIAPPAIRPVYTLVGTVISTPGNLTAITSAIKTGKSAVIGAMAASAMASGNAGDLLGFRSSNQKERGLLHFDLEQSPDDHWHQIKRALIRAGLQMPPPWFYSYCLTGLGHERVWECITRARELACEHHDGIHSMLIDGIADLVADVNDAAECNRMVAALHDLAIQHQCPMVGIIHFNPGSDKVRGHLGSQFERKAETNLRLDKRDGVTTIWSDKQRRAPIPKDTGPRFKWSDEQNMHVSVQNLQNAQADQEKERLNWLVGAIFSGKDSMRYSELVNGLMASETVSKKTAERRVTRMCELGALRKSDAGLYAPTV